MFLASGAQRPDVSVFCLVVCLLCLAQYITTGILVSALESAVNAVRQECKSLL